MNSYERLSAKVITSDPTNFGSSTLSTTPVEVTLVAATGLNQKKLVKISNLHASNLVAWKLVAKGAAAPTLVTTLGNANQGAIVPPSQSDEFVIGENHDLYIVASAGSTTVSVRSVLIG